VKREESKAKKMKAKMKGQAAAAVRRQADGAWAKNGGANNIAAQHQRRSKAAASKKTSVAGEISDAAS
jgi:hypothetical protein